MVATDKVFAGSIPKLYDEYLVPLIFADFAADMAARVAALAPSSVLEIAAGTGAVTRALAARLPTDVRYVATDLNEPMLAIAAERLADDPRLSWRRADAQSLPFDAAAFDVVCCQFGAMFFPDRIMAYGEAKRVLTPGGVFLFNVWDRIEDNELAHEVTSALSALFPDDPPRFLARTPHGYCDETIIATELKAAGFRDVAIARRTAISRAPTPAYAAIAYCQGTPLRSEIESRAADGLQAATDKATAAIATRWGSATVEAKMQGLVITARP